MRVSLNLESMWKVLAAVAIALVIFGYVVRGWVDSNGPDCPTEDSCEPQYDSERHEWTIIEVTP